MKLDCQIIRDLLPLYEDGVCSEKSREAVKDHLTACRDCAELAGKQLPLPELPESEPEEQAVAKSFRKVRRRWVLSLLILLVALPVLYMLGRLGWNEYQKEGICFSNLDTVWAAEDFADALEEGDYSALVNQMEFSDDYDSIQEALSMSLEDHMPQVTRVRIGGTDYQAYVCDYMVKKCKKEDFWEMAVFNGWHRVMIPEEIFWDTVAGQEYFGDSKGITLLHGGCFYPVELKWGKFYVEQNFYGDVMLRRNDALELYRALEIWPEDLYEEALPAIEAAALEEYTSSQEWNAPYAHMSLEEYNALRRERLVQDLKNLVSQGVRIESKGAEYAYYTEDGWSVQVRFSMETPTGTMRFTLDLRETGEYVSFVGSHTDPADHVNPWYNALLDALW